MEELSITAIPLTWLIVITSTAAWEKPFSSELRIGFLSHAQDLTIQLAAGTLPPNVADTAQQLIFNDYLAATLTGFFLVTTWVLVFDTLRVSYRIITGMPHPPLS